MTMCLELHWEDAGGWVVYVVEDEEYLASTAYGDDLTAALEDIGQGANKNGKI